MMEQHSSTPGETHQHMHDKYANDKTAVGIKYL